MGQSGMFGAGGAGQGPSSSVNATGAQDKRLGILVNDKLEAIRAAWDMQNIQACQFMVSERSLSSRICQSFRYLTCVLTIVPIL